LFAAKDELENMQNIQIKIEEVELLIKDGIIKYNNRNVAIAERNNICANLWYL